METMGSKKQRRLFGTDGIRGVANIAPLTADFALKVGQAAAAFFLQKQRRRGWKHASAPRPKIVIGKDTRIANYMLEQAVASGVCSMGVDAVLLGPMPTPGVSFLVKSMRADSGIMISASHNTFEYSGIKIFAPDGDKLPDDDEWELENLILGEKALPQLPSGTEIGKATRIEDALGRYIVHTKSAFPSELSLEGMRIVLNCANGAAYKVAPIVFQELGAEVITTGVSPNGSNINAGYGALFPERVAAMVNEYRADVGISLDGDGDRVIFADEKGEVVDGDVILAITAVEMKKIGQLRKDTVVGTVMLNLGMRAALAKENIKFCEVPVGDRYILSEIRKGQYSLGGEPSGHIIFSDFAATGDGVLSALKLLEVMCRREAGLSQLKKIVKKFPQVLENVPVKEKKPLAELPLISKRIDVISQEMGNSGRILVRYSGTEPVVRVMVEGESMEKIQGYAREVAELFREI
jgi:phosphoglucosamine mutase